MPFWSLYIKEIINWYTIWLVSQDIIELKIRVQSTLVDQNGLIKYISGVSGSWFWSNLMDPSDSKTRSFNKYQNLFVLHFVLRFFYMSYQSDISFIFWANFFCLFRQFKGQIKPKADWSVVDSPKKRKNESVLFTFLLFTANKTNLFVRFLGESMERPICFQFYLTFNMSWIFLCLLYEMIEKLHSTIRLQE